jgi:hypothetical protein
MDSLKMNVKEYQVKKHKDLASSIKRIRTEDFSLIAGVKHLPVEIQELSDVYLFGQYYATSYYVYFSNPDHWKTLKMAGVTGLKRTFNGHDENDWKWEGGQLIVHDDVENVDYEYSFIITKAARPESCRIELQEVPTIVKKYVAICPESMEEVH